MVERELRMRQNAIRLARLAKGASNLLLHFDHAQNPFGLLLVNGMDRSSRNVSSCVDRRSESSSRFLAYACLRCPRRFALSSSEGGGWPAKPRSRTSKYWVTHSSRSSGGGESPRAVAIRRPSHACPAVYFHLSCPHLYLLFLLTGQ